MATAHHLVFAKNAGDRQVRAFLPLTDRPARIHAVELIDHISRVATACLPALPQAHTTSDRQLSAETARPALRHTVAAMNR